MRNNFKTNRIVLLTATAAFAALGSTCASPGLLPADTVAIVFVNRSGFEVDPTVEGERMETVIPDRTTRPILFDCSPGQRYVFSGSVRTNTQTLPSPYWFTFYDGVNANCGGTIQITYFMNDGDLDLDGIAY
jgi:hypothetical protein